MRRVVILMVGLGGMLVGLVVGCTPAAAPATYNATTKRIVDARCTGCHREGGIGPMPLTAYQDLVAFKDIVIPAIESGTMPPWLANDTCTTYSNNGDLTPDEKDTLLGWLKGEMPEGETAAESADAARDPSVPPIRYDELFDAADAPYSPQSDDDYRCYAIRWPYDVEKYITGFDMLPGDPANVHHVNIFLNPPGDTDFAAIDDADPAPGFDCGNGDRVLASSLVGAWAPGASGTHYPTGTGQLVVPGSTITLEVHYARVAGSLPDASKLALETADSVDQRGLGVAFYWFNHWDNGGMPIPAGNADVTHELEVDPALELAVVAPWIHARTVDVHVAALHMHQLGKSGEIAIRSSSGEDTCLLQIPRWDFHWQMGYALERPAHITLGRDKLYLRCTWDNSPEHQPLVDGVRQVPRDVNWGSRTTDEMCIGFLYLVPEQ